MRTIRAVRTTGVRRLKVRMAARRGVVLLGAGLVLLALVIPIGWYETPPLSPDFPGSPFNGVLLLKGGLLLCGSAVLLGGSLIRSLPRGAAAG